MTTPRAVQCKHLRMRPMAAARAERRKPQSAAVCENVAASSYGSVLQHEYDIAQWAELNACHSCPHYQGLHP